MDWKELVIDGYSRVLEALEPALDGLTPEDLDKQPKPDCNSMGWITWHLIRGQDSQIADLMDEEQLWVRDKWCEKFNRPTDPDDTGFGHTPEQVAAFKSPKPQVFLDYHRAVFERTRQYIRSLKRSDLDRELNEPWFQPLPTVGVRLVSIMADCLEHAGQVAYIRGFYKGVGWWGA